MIRFRLYFDKDAETKWLNEMAEQGWAMKSFFAGFYSFERCEPGQYMYQVDSPIEHYTKIRRMFKAVAVVEILCLFMERYAGYSDKRR